MLSQLQFTNRFLKKMFAVWKKCIREIKKETKEEEGKKENKKREIKKENKRKIKKENKNK